MITKTRLFYFGVLTALLFMAVNACQKHTSSPGVDCISQTGNTANQLQLSGPDLDTVKTLFAGNNLDATRYHFLSYSVVPGADAGKPPVTQVAAIDVVNGLLVFGSYEIVFFTNGKLDSAYLDTAKAASADISGNQSLESLRAAFLAKASESTIYSSVGNSTGDPNKVKDSCLTATLGYIDAASKPGSTVPPGTSLIKVWVVSPASIDFPAVYIEDATGAAWGEVFIYP